MAQLGLHPSQATVPLSSQASPPATMPSPQLATHTLGCPKQLHPPSTVHVALHPSHPERLLSSHASPPVTIPSPQIALQVTPSPVYPESHAQLNDHVVLLHVALASQLSVPSTHSFSSLQVTPSPVYPESHAQLNDPVVLEHVALASQLSVPKIHSLSSLQTLG